MVTNLQKGNSFYKNKDFQNAIIHYGRALRDNPNLSRLVAFNIFLSRNRLSLEFPHHKILDFLQDTSCSYSNEFDFNPSIIFDYQFYLENNSDVRESGIDPQVHYYEYGEIQNRWPNQFFDPAYYRRRYADLELSNISLFEHYISVGINEKRQTRDIKLKQSNFKRGGTLLLVTHDTEVGGAQQVLKLFARWIVMSTPYDIQIVSIKSGNLRHTFEEIAPCFVLSDIQIAGRKSALEAWMNHDICAVFINSIASVEVLNYIDQSIPSISFIHEMPKILEKYRDSIELLRNNNVRILTGGPEVGRAFVDQYKFDPSQVFNCVSFIEPMPKVDLGMRRLEARKSFDISDDDFLIFGCGVLHWRKSPKTFIEVAERVISTHDNVYFVWLGGGPDQKTCEELVRKKGLEKRVLFTGYEPNVSEKLAGGDLFLLTSEEDPFPLVALYAAQAGMPIVCFKEAGGIEGFVESGSGISTPFMNIENMVCAVINYINNPSMCKRDGNQGKRQVKLNHTVNSVAPILMHHVRDVAKLSPSISVVVPNYNYESYLIERLDTISSQTFQDFEVVLLDDCSSDDSVKILEEFAARRPGTQLIINQENSGSPFVQWIRGMKLANAELIWLAEADDRCTSDLLEMMLPIFDDRNVFIASCGSQPITSDGNIIGDYRDLYLNRISLGRWNKDYITTDHDEINHGLGIANSIPNASAVIFRKFIPDPQFKSEVTEMRLCGDWYFYLRAMQGGLIGFKSMVMNDHRRHGNTVTHNLEGSIRYFDELATVRNYINRTFRQSSAALHKVKDFLEQDIHRFHVTDANALPKSILFKKTLPSLLMVAPDLSPGGGQVFAISVANEWVSRGGRCLLLNVSNQESHKEVLKQISDRVIYFDLQEIDYDLKTLIKDFDIDVVHSCIWWADRWVDEHRDELPADMPWIITMHGCHETILHNSNIDSSFFERMDRMTKRARWVYTAEKNLEVFDTVERPQQLVKIGNGTKDQTLITQLSRHELGLRDDSVVLCLASRAIDCKGWFEAVRLVERLVEAGNNAELLLIGEGPAADDIRALSPKNVSLVGQVSNLHDYLSICDIGILPSYFPGESFPLILLEMMCNSLPIIASDIGEIPSIIGDKNEAAGLVVPRTASGINEDALYNAVIKLLDFNLRSRYAKISRLRYEDKFSVKTMVDAYEDCYYIS
jgi:glycosyltransferase involved in cell wall biosynthesis